VADVLLYLWGDRRSTLLQELDFYLTQADRRVLIQFGNFEEEAEQFARDQFDQMGQRAGPDANPGDYADAAYSKGINHYEMLSDLQGQMLLSVAAGLYHHWEKQFHQWLAKELDHSFPREKLTPAVWKQSIEDLFDLLKGLGWDVSAYPFAGVIEECRLVVNVYKHGSGPSFNVLKANYSQHLGGTQAGVSIGYRDHTHLEITRGDVGRFQQALREFWQAVPEQIFWSDKWTVPKWFDKALKKDK